MSNHRVFILGYHEIVQSPSRKKYAVSEELFLKQLLWLKNNHFRVISLSDLYASLVPNTELPQNGVVLTFDDGLMCHFNLAYPILKEFNFPASFFVIAGFVGKNGFMDWGHLEKLQAAGMQIGSHGYSHNLLNLMPEEEIKKEFLLSKTILEKNLNRPIDFLSMPRGQDNLKVRQIAQSSGYKAICVSSPGYIYKDSSVFSLSRFFLHSNNTLADFANILSADPLMHFKIKIQAMSLWLLRNILGMRLYEKIRMRVLKDEYSY